jgi:hypothetical protein
MLGHYCNFAHVSVVQWNKEQITMKTLLIILTLVFSSTASATIISISTNSVDVVVGGNVTIDINISNAVEFDFLTFEFGFDSNVLDFVSVSNPQLGFFADDGDADIGALYLSLNGFIDPFSAPTTYSGNFLLASLNFRATADGTATFNGLFSNIDAFELDFASLGVPEIRTANAVNAPSTIGLAALLLTGLLQIRRSK